MAASVISEQGIFHLIRQRLGDENFLDDAYVSPSGQVITTDMLVDGRHFDRSYCSPFDIGWKAAAVSLSDIASCGASPTGLLLGLALPPETSIEFVNKLYDGLLACLDTYQTPLLGGDTVSSATLTLSTTVLGQIPTGQAAGRRFNAQPGDTLWLCGAHGLSAVGLWALQQGINGFDNAKLAHRQPKPLLNEASLLAERVNNNRYALTDTSDGLADALLNMADASGVCCEVNASTMPIANEVSDWVAAYSSPMSVDKLSPELAITLYGGEDFGLLAALPPNITPPQPEWAAIGHVSASETPLATVRLLSGERVRLSRTQTYQHFPNLKNH